MVTFNDSFQPWPRPFTYINAGETTSIVMTRGIMDVYNIFFVSQNTIEPCVSQKNQKVKFAYEIFSQYGQFDLSLCLVYTASFLCVLNFSSKIPPILETAQVKP